MKSLILAGKYGTEAIGNVCLVDDIDYDYLSQFIWYCKKADERNKYYVYGNINSRKVSIHRNIMQIKDSSIFVDHIDGNPLNNQRSNLRLCTPAQNSANRKPLYGKKYKGISKMKYSDKYKPTWRVYIIKDGKTYCDTAVSEIEAAQRYNEMAIELHGEFANLNVIDEKLLLEWKNKRYCYGCRIHINKDLFGVDKTKPDGIAHKCRACKRVIDTPRKREYNKKLREKKYNERIVWKGYL